MAGGTGKLKASKKTACNWLSEAVCLSGLQDDRTADIVPGGFDLDSSGGLVPSNTYLPRRRCVGCLSYSSISPSTPDANAAATHVISHQPWKRLQTKLHGKLHDLPSCRLSASKNHPRTWLCHPSALATLSNMYSVASVTGR